MNCLGPNNDNMFFIYIAYLCDERQHTYWMAKVAPGLGDKSRTRREKSRLVNVRPPIVSYP